MSVCESGKAVTIDGVGELRKISIPTPASSTDSITTATEVAVAVGKASWDKGGVVDDGIVGVADGK